MKLLGVYTSGPQGKWNPDGNDASTNVDWEAGIRSFEKNVGHSVNAVNVFPCWGSMKWWGVNLDKLIMQGIYKSGFGKGLVPVVGLKMFSQKQSEDFGPNGYQWNDANGYKDVANGKWDDTWRGIAQALAAAPYSIVRISDEYNGSFMEDFMGWDKPTQQSWVAGFNRAASVMKAEAKRVGAKLDVVLNPNIMINCPSVEDNLPDLANFDGIAADFYNGFWGEGDVNDPAVRRNCWDVCKGGFGWNQYIALLKKTGKWAFLAECGSGASSGGPAHGITEDRLYWPYVTEKINAIRAAGIPFRGGCVWNIQPQDGNWKFTDGAQPGVLSNFKAALPVFIGDDTDGKVSAAAATSAPVPVAASASPAPVPAASTLPESSVGTFGADKLVLTMAEDGYQGDAQFIVRIDGQKVGGVQTVKATRAGNQTQDFVIHGMFGTIKRVVKISFLNDAYGGKPELDRNLYLVRASINGVLIPGSTLSIQNGDPQSFTMGK